AETASQSTAGNRASFEPAFCCDHPKVSATRVSDPVPNRCGSDRRSLDIVFSTAARAWREVPSMESRVQAALASLPAFLPGSRVQLMEHLAILKRWYFRGTRAGEIFFADEKGVLPIRRIVRG